MKSIYSIFIVIVFLMIGTCFGQIIVCPIYQMPSFPGGDDSLNSYLRNNLKYPKEALKDSVQGIVYTNFIVDETGKIIDVKILKSIRNDLDSEAIRVVCL